MKCITQCKRKYPLDEKFLNIFLGIDNSFIGFVYIHETKMVSAVSPNRKMRNEWVSEIHRRKDDRLNEMVP